MSFSFAWPGTSASFSGLPNAATWIGNGMVPLLHCRQILPKTAIHLDSMGWPCYIGGSVAFTGLTRDARPKNCMIFYNFAPQDLFVPDSQSLRMNRYVQSRNRCLGNQPAIFDTKSTEKINLTKLAVCIYGKYPYGDMIGRANLQSLRGVAVIAGLPHDLGTEEGFASAAPDGWLLTELVDIKERQEDLDLNHEASRPMSLRLIVGFSTIED